MTEITTHVDFLRNYIEGLSLPYQTVFSEAKVLDEEGGMYRIPVKLISRDGTTITFGVSLYPEVGDEEDYMPTKEELAVVMRGVNGHYVLIKTRDAKTARKITDQVYRIRGVDNVQTFQAGDMIGIEDEYKDLFYGSGFGPMRDSTPSSSFRSKRVKRGERKRRQLLSELRIGGGFVLHYPRPT